MADKSRFESCGSMWATTLAGGGKRRIWVSMADGAYVCARELCSAAQEAARVRVFAAEVRHEPPAVEDLREWSGAHFAQLRTSHAAEAWVFLGADELAQCALEECDPSLAGAFVPEAPCEAFQDTRRVAMR